MFRIANEKQYELIESEANLTMSITSADGSRRDFVNLKLEVNRINFMPLSWTIVHAIDAESPLYGLTLKDLDERDTEIIILIKSINDTYSQTVYSRHSYKAEDVVEQAKFKPMKQEAERNGKIKISVTDIHKYDLISKI